MPSGGVSVGLGGGGEVVLRPATPEDYEEMVLVYASTREPELAQVTWWDDAQKTEYDARYPDAQYDVIVLEGRTAGRVWIGRDADEIHMLDITVLPWAQGRGVGTAIVKTLVEEARASGKHLRHMVFVLNEGARRLYERLGFVVFDEAGGARRPRRRGAPAGPAAGASLLRP